MRLSKIVQEIQAGQNQPQPSTAEFSTLKKMSVDEKKRLKQLVYDYNQYGDTLYPKKSLTEIAQKLQEISTLGESYIKEQQEGWFEEGIVKRNFGQINKNVGEFVKLAKEVDSANKQLCALFEEIGTTLERYFEISDAQNTADVSGGQAPSDQAGKPINSKDIQTGE